MSAAAALPVRLAERPRLFLVEAFASEEELAHLGSAAPAEGGELPVGGDPILEELSLRLQRVFKMGDHLPEAFAVERVVAGEGRPAGLDVVRMREFYRLVTAVLFLDPPAAGGMLRFPEAQPGAVAVRPRRGRLVAWLNHRPNGEVEPCARHGLDPVESGVSTHVLMRVHRPLQYAARLIEGTPAEGVGDGPLEVGA